MSPTPEQNTVVTLQTTSPTPTPTPTAAPATAAKPAKKPAPKGKTAKAAKGKAKKAKKPSKSGASKDVKGPAVLKQYAPEYVKGGKDGEAKTAGGNRAIDCGDKLAEKLRGMDLDAVYTMAAKVLETTEKELRAKYKDLNIGMQRMNLGNRMRGVLNAK